MLDSLAFLSTLKALKAHPAFLPHPFFVVRYRLSPFAFPVHVSTDAAPAISSPSAGMLHKRKTAPRASLASLA